MSIPVGRENHVFLVFGKVLELSSKSSHEILTLGLGLGSGFRIFPVYIWYSVLRSIYEAEYVSCFMSRRLSYLSAKLYSF